MWQRAAVDWMVLGLLNLNPDPQFVLSKLSKGLWKPSSASQPVVSHLIVQLSDTVGGDLKEYLLLQQQKPFVFQGLESLGWSGGKGIEHCNSES